MWMVDKLLTTENGAMYRGAVKEGKKPTGMTELYSTEKKTLHDTSSLSHTLPPSLIYVCVSREGTWGNKKAAVACQPLH